jgi:hypothetical protein
MHVHLDYRIYYSGLLLVETCEMHLHTIARSLLPYTIHILSLNAAHMPPTPSDPAHGSAPVKRYVVFHPPQIDALSCSSGFMMGDKPSIPFRSPLPKKTRPTLMKITMRSFLNCGVQCDTGPPTEAPSLSYKNCGVQYDMRPTIEAPSLSQVQGSAPRVIQAPTSATVEPRCGSTSSFIPSGLGSTDLSQIIINGCSLADIIQEAREDAVRETMEHVEEKMDEIFGEEFGLDDSDYMEDKMEELFGEEFDLDALVLA